MKQLLKKFQKKQNYFCCVFYLLIISNLLLVQRAIGQVREDRYKVKVQTREFIPEPGISKQTQLYLEKQYSIKKTPPHVLVQFKQEPIPMLKKQLEASGLRLVYPASKNTWYATLSDSAYSKMFDKQTANNFKGVFSSVRWIGEITPKDKMHPDFSYYGPGGWAILPDKRIKLIVSFFDDVLPQQAKIILKTYNAEIEVERPLSYSYYIIINPNNLDSLLLEDEVKYIEQYPTEKKEFNDGSRAYTNTDYVHNLGITGKGVILGIWDGDEVDDSHDDLAGRVIFGQPVRTYTKSLHATHVAGTMAGNGTGDPKYKGHAPDVPTIVSYDYVGPTPVEMMRAMADYHIQFCNNSWGLRIGWDGDRISGWRFINNQRWFGNYYTECFEYDKLVKESYLGLVFAVGNDRNDPDDPAVITELRPADWDQGYGYDGYRTIAPYSTAKNVISVGAIDDSDGSMTAFSNWGPTDMGQIKPDVVAPGYNIVSCNTSNDYTSLRGTSMAAPAVTGIAALLVQAFHKYYSGGLLESGDPLPSSVKALLVQGAKDLFATGPDYKSGWGAVDALNSVNLIINQQLIERTIRVGREHIYNIHVNNDQNYLKVTLAWDDYPGNFLINDLNLSLESPSGEHYYPWLLNPQNPSLPADTGVDNNNNVEQVFVKGPEEGEWKIKVNGNGLKYFEQNYSLICGPAFFSSSTKNYEYAAKVVLGNQRRFSHKNLIQGRYTTSVNIHNPQPATNSYYSKLALTYPPGNMVPGDIIPFGNKRLGSDEASSIDFTSIQSYVDRDLYNEYIEGFVVIQSDQPLDVYATYTNDGSRIFSFGNSDLEVERVECRKLKSTEKLPDLIPVSYKDGYYFKYYNNGNVDRKVGFRIRNIGNVSCGPFQVDLHIKYGSGTTDMLGTVYLSGIQKDEEFELFLPPKIEFDEEDEFTVIIDELDDIKENNEDNNIMKGNADEAP